LRVVEENQRRVEQLPKRNIFAVWGDATAASARYNWIDGKEARNVPADIVHEDNSALARVARKTAPGAALAALGIVYGDLGTSPLYRLRAVVGATGGHFSREAALGSLSLIFRALIITTSVKYCLFVMRADNHGEGGILALMSMTGANWSEGRRTLAEMIGTTRSRVSFFMNKFRTLGFIDYNGGVEVHSSLLNAVLRDQPQSKN
jgi:K+ potassium transporter